MKLKYAIPAIFAADLSYVATIAFVKEAALRDISTMAIILGRGIIGFTMTLLFMKFSDPHKALKKKVATSRFVLHFVRGVSTLIAMFLNYYAIRYIPVSDATLLYFSFPLFLPFVGYFWAKEKFPARILWAIALGFIGILMIIKPGHQLFNIKSFAALSAAFFAAIGQYATRLLHTTENSSKIVFYFFFWAFIIPLATFFFTPSANLEHLKWEDWWLFFGFGIPSWLYIWFLTIAIKYATPTVISSFLYFIVFFTLCLDRWVWHTPFTLLSFMGFIVVICAIFLKIYMYKIHFLRKLK